MLLLVWPERLGHPLNMTFQHMVLGLLKKCSVLKLKYPRRKKKSLEINQDKPKM